MVTTPGFQCFVFDRFFDTFFSAQKNLIIDLKHGDYCDGEIGTLAQSVSNLEEEIQIAASTESHPSPDIHNNVLSSPITTRQRLISDYVEESGAILREVESRSFEYRRARLHHNSNPLPSFLKFQVCLPAFGGVEEEDDY